MRKRCICALMISLCLTLGACGPAGGGEKKQDAAQLLQAEYQSLDGCSMTAEVRCDRADAVEEYTLHCDWTADGEAVVSVLAPEELAGIQAAFSGEELTLIYEDMSLAAGPVSEEALSPAQVLPMLMQGICEGYIQEKGAEQIGEENCLRLLFDTTGPSGGKIDYAVWFRADHTPARAEVLVGNDVVFTVTFTEFSALAQEESGGAAGSA